MSARSLALLALLVACRPPAAKCPAPPPPITIVAPRAECNLPPLPPPRQGVGVAQPDGVLVSQENWALWIGDKVLLSGWIRAAKNCLGVP